MDVERFKSAVQSLARPNLFQVTLTFPTGSDEITQFLCKGASIPTRTIGNFKVKYQASRSIVFPGDTSFSDWSVSVYNDLNYTVRKRLEAWAELINGAVDNKSEIVANNVKRNMRVDQLDGQHNIIKTYHMIGCLPTDVGGTIRLSWDSADTPEEYDVTFAYDYWESETTRGART
jgi:nucleoid DNA-binding protein